MFEKGTYLGLLWFDQLQSCFQFEFVISSGYCFLFRHVYLLCILMMLRGGSAVLTTRPIRLFTSASHLRQPLLNHDARRTLKTVAEVVAQISIEDFRRDAFEAQKPLLIRPESSESPTVTLELPALTKWFTTSPTTGKASLTPYLDTFRSTILQYELSSPNSAQFSDFITWLQSSESSSPMASGSSSSNSDSEASQSRLALSHLLKTYTSDSEFLTLDLPLHLLLLAPHFCTHISSCVRNASHSPPK